VVYDDDYRDLVKQVQGAVEDLLDASTPDSWLSLRAGYAEMRKALAADETRRNLAEVRDELKDIRAEEERRKRTHEQHQEQRRRERAERRDVWRRTPKTRRENLVLNALRDDRLTHREVADRVDADLREGVEGERLVYESYTRLVVMRLFKEGQLEREPDEACKKLRYRYFRKRRLEGPIVDLERVYHENGGEH
jgi:hypothetical protein